MTKVRKKNGGRINLSERNCLGGRHHRLHSRRAHLVDRVANGFVGQAGELCRWEHHREIHRHKMVRLQQ